MENREQRCPFLEEDVDHLIRDQPWRSFEGNDALGVRNSRSRSSAEEGARVDVSGQSACLLCLLLKCLCEVLDALHIF
jgi:hypothetical protein